MYHPGRPIVNGLHLSVIRSELQFNFMAAKKNKTTKQTQLLSPENYIRQKSRNLPLGECFISSNWRTCNLGQIVITRKHTNGNVTACMYLADLACLGIKDTAYKFNVPFGEIENLMENSIDKDIEFCSISYEMAHNIIYACLEYAEEYGFKPCKDFALITRYFLEEDTDDIPLIEIACGGKDGNPLYINTGFDSPVRERQILAQLEKIAGKDNYTYILHAGGGEKFYDEDEDKAEEEEEQENEQENERNEILKEIRQLDKEERKKLFVSLFTQKGENLSDDDITRLSVLTNMLAYDIASDEAIDMQFDKLEKKFEREFVTADQLPNSLFTGIQNIDGETISDLFFSAMNELKDINKTPKNLTAFQEKVGEVPVVAFLELLYLSETGSKKFHKKWEEYYQKYPHYFLLQLYQETTKEALQENSLERLEELLLSEKQPITQFEAEFFFFFYAYHLVQNKHTDIAAILAFEEYLYDTFTFLTDQTILKISSIIQIAKLSKIIEHSQQTGN